MTYVNPDGSPVSVANPEQKFDVQYGCCSDTMRYVNNVYLKTRVPGMEFIDVKQFYSERFELVNIQYDFGPLTIEARKPKQPDTPIGTLYIPKEAVFFVGVDEIFR
jgi:hypothetical protein